MWLVIKLPNEQMLSLLSLFIVEITSTINKLREIIMTNSVLIVEDNEHLRLLFSIAFEKVGFTVDSAENGLVALGKIEQQTYDIVTLDIDMPGISGLDVLEKMQSIPTTSNTKVIIVTGNDQYAWSEKAKLADLILLKPVGFKQLLVLANRLISQNQSIAS